VPRSLFLLAALALVHCAPSFPEDADAPVASNATSTPPSADPNAPGGGKEMGPGGGGAGRGDDEVDPTETVTSPLVINAAASAINGERGASVIALASPEVFEVGQELLLHQTGGATAGAWERVTIASLAGSAATLTKPLANTYKTTTEVYPFDRAQAVVVARYTSLRIAPGGKLSAPPWNGSTGGIFALRATGTIRVETPAGITMAGRGYAGGTSSTHTNFRPIALHADGGASFQTRGPESCMWAPCSARRRPLFGGGGGGRKAFNGIGSGGAGGGHATIGLAGGHHGEMEGGAEGEAYGDDSGATIFFGSGGGAGAFSRDPAFGRGGAGGGIVLVEAATIVLATPGAIDARGANGTTEYVEAGMGQGGGGGGAGGSVFLIGPTTGIEHVDVRGGEGGGVATPGNTQRGGAGARGRIHRPASTL